MRWRRWLNVVLRGLHLAAVIALGAAVLGAPVDLHQSAIATLVTGFGMLALDVWGNPDHLRQAAGLSVIAKLVFVGWMAVDADHRLLLFWLIVAGSATFRHAILIRSR
jgi:hypothetical protein